MNNSPSSNELLKKAKIILKKEGSLIKPELTTQEMLKEYILPGLKNSKDILSSLYSFQTRSRDGLMGKFKSLIQNKIVFTVINVIERLSTRQQKFNELTYKAIELLIKENNNLRQEISKLNK